MDKTCKSSGMLWVAIFAASSGARVRNTWAICHEVGENSEKSELIPNVAVGGHPLAAKAGSQGLALLDEPAAYQLVGRVTAYQGKDG